MKLVSICIFNIKCNTINMYHSYIKIELYMNVIIYNNIKSDLGIRFRMVGSRLNLEIMVTPFNFTSGLLIQPEEKSFWYSNDVTDR